MVNRRIVDLKLAELADRIARVRGACPKSLDEFRGDRDASDVVSFNLLLAVQTCSDLASHIIAEVHSAAINSLGDLELFLQEVSRWVIVRTNA